MVLNVVIPAGGSGTRLWPLSRANHPKFLHALTGTSATLLQATVARLAPVTSPARTYVVTGTAHAASVARQVPFLPEENIVVEPSGRDSCGAIGLAAAIIARREPTALMGAFSADHIVRDEKTFVECVRAAMAGAESGRLMVFGVTPTHPETGYGYVECAEQIGDGPARRVTQFKEKPSAEVAAEYVRSGRHFWNASMFVWRVDAFLAELKRQQPAMHDVLMEIAASWDGPERQEVLDRAWPRLPKISVDYAVMEGAAEAGLVAAVPSDIGWSDVGDFHALAESLATEAAENVIIDPGGTATAPGEGKGPVLLEACSGTVVVPHSGRLVAALGVQDVIIVDTPDALLVCARSESQKIKELVQTLNRDGHDEFL
jgi:mannose-1-phosphate guanylyltransferase